MADATTTSRADDAGETTRQPVAAGVAGAAALGLVIGWSIEAARGSVGSVFAGLPYLWAVLLVLVGHHLYRPFAAAILNGGAAPSWRRHLRRHLAVVLPVWVLAVVGAILLAPVDDNTMPTDAFSPVPAGETAVPLASFLRHLVFGQLYSTDAVPSVMAPTWIIATGVAFLVLVPVIAWIGRRFSSGERPRRFRVQLMLGLATIGVGVLARVLLVLVGGDRTAALTARTWLPNHLDLLGAGMLLAIVLVDADDGGPASVTVERMRRSLTGVRAAAPAVGGFMLLTLVGLAWDRTPNQPVPGAPTELLLGFGLLLGALLIVAPALAEQVSRRSASPSTGAAWRCRLDHLAIGLVAWYPFVLARWVSAPGVDGAPAAPARRPGQLHHVAVVPTVLFVTLGTILVALVVHLLLRRPVRRLRRGDLSRFGIGLTIISSLSFLSRIWGLGAVTVKNPGNGDPFFYHAQANMLADGVGFAEPIRWLTEGRFVPTAIHPPIYTLWLTPSSMLGARGFLPHKTMGVVAGLLVVIVAAMLVRRLAGDRAGLIAAAVVSLYPNLWLIDGTLWPEGLYTATIGLALLMAYRWRAHPTLAAAATLGVSCGIAIMTRGEALLLLPLLCLPLAVAARRDLATWFRHLLLMGLAAGLVVLPWVVRNQIRFGEFVAVSTNSEEVLFYANCEDVYSGEMMGFWSFACQERVREERIAIGEEPDPPGNEAQRARAWGEMGRRYALDHRDRLPAVAVARVARAWDLAYAQHNVRALVIEGRPKPWAQAGLWIYRVVGVAGIAGIVVLRRRGEAIWPLVSTVAMVTVIAVYAYGHVRFRTAGDLVLIVGAAVLIDSILPGRRNTAP